MQNVTSSPHQVALNAQIEVNSVEHSSNQASRNIVSRVASAALSVITTIARAIYDTVMWAPNKVYNLLYPTSTAANEDDIEIQQDTLVANLYDSNEVDAENDIPNPVVVDGEELPEPISTSQDWQKAAMIGGGVVGVVGLVFGLAIGVYYAFPKTIPGVEPLSDFATDTVLSYISHAWTVLTDTVGGLWNGNPNPYNYPYNNP